MSVQKYSMIISGHGTSFSLEPEFWNVLKKLAVEKQISVRTLVEQIDETRTGNLSSALRVYVLNELKKKSGF